MTALPTNRGRRAATCVPLAAPAPDAGADAEPDAAADAGLDAEPAVDADTDADIRRDAVAIADDTAGCGCRSMIAAPPGMARARLIALLAGCLCIAAARRGAGGRRQGK